MGEELSRRGCPILLAGNAAHADLRGDAPVAGSSAGCWRCSARITGSRCPKGDRAAGRGAGRARGRPRATRALRQPVRRIGVTDGRAVARAHLGRANRQGSPRGARRRTRRTCSGLCRPNTCRRAVRDLDHFQWDAPVVKVDWALTARCRGPPRPPGPDRPSRASSSMARPVDGALDAALPAPVPAFRPDDDERPDAAHRRARNRMGVHPPAARIGDDAGGRAGTSASTQIIERLRAGFARPGGRTARAVARRPAAAEPVPGRRCGERRHGAASSSWSSGRCRGWAAPRPRRPALHRRLSGPSRRGGARDLRSPRRPRRAAATHGGWASRAAAPSPPPSTWSTAEVTRESARSGERMCDSGRAPDGTFAVAERADSR